MTPEQYLSWLDKEIGHFDKSVLYAEPYTDLALPSHLRGLLEAYQRCRDKFLTIEYPQPTETENNFTDGL